MYLRLGIRGHIWVSIDPVPLFVNSYGRGSECLHRVQATMAIGYHHLSSEMFLLSFWGPCRCPCVFSCRPVGVLTAWSNDHPDHRLSRVRTYASRVGTTMLLLGDWVEMGISSALSLGESILAHLAPQPQFAQAWRAQDEPVDPVSFSSW